MFQDKSLRDAVEATERRSGALRPRMNAADRVLGAIGDELRGILIIFLALVILCAPTGIGLALVWGAYAGTVVLTGSETLGRIAGIAVCAFLCRYVWGVRLQGAARRAAVALVAGR